MYRILVFLLIFCSCAKKQKNQAELNTSVEINLIESNSFEEGEWPEVDWWTLFQDKQLNWIVEQSIANNPDLHMALANVQQATAFALKEKAVLFPEIFGDAAYDWHHYSAQSLFRFPPSPIPALINQFDISLGLSYELDIWGKNRDQYRAAVGAAKAQIAEAAQIQLSLATAVASTYVAYWSNLQQLQISEQLLSKKKAFLFLREKRRDCGLDDEIDVLSAREAFIELEKRVADLKTVVELTLFQLKSLMGLSPDHSLYFVSPSPEFNRPFQLPANLPIDLLARRPDLMRLIHLVDAQSYNIKVARKAFYPNINLLSMVGFESLAIKDLFKISSYQGFLRPALHLPIFTGGRLEANLDEQYAAFNAAVYEYNNTLLIAAKEVASGIQNLQNGIEQVELEGEVLDTLSQTLHLSKRRMQDGLDNYLMVLIDEEKLLEGELVNTQLNEKRLFFVVQLLKALGGGYHGK